MSRYRAPEAPKSNYLTAEGEARLRQELDFLWREERPLVTRQVSEAAALGDRSENAEYIYGKKRLREIDRRVRYLRKRLEAAVVVRTVPDNQQKVYFGAWVTLDDDNGNTQQYRIVGPDEIGDHPQYVSMDAPLGRAMMGKQLDDEFTVSSPAGKTHYTIADISYGAAP